uniref:Fatty acyl-CoA reductase n=1 Tax=Cacopsylla melanoneura TaxID=428564 RepID=A0A8D9E8T1_9HEMI
MRRIILLVRPKKGKTSNERLEELFDDLLFFRLKTEVPHFRDKVAVVDGDVSASNLGLSVSDRTLLTDTVNVVLHGAATVRFDENIKTAIAINICGVQAMIKLAREMKYLKSFVHVSTAFSQCPHSEIKETFYSPPYDYDSLTRLIMTSQHDDDKLEDLTRVCIYVPGASARLDRQPLRSSRSDGGCRNRSPSFNSQ